MEESSPSHELKVFWLVKSDRILAAVSPKYTGNWQHLMSVDGASLVFDPKYDVSLRSRHRKTQV